MSIRAASCEAVPKCDRRVSLIKVAADAREGGATTATQRRNRPLVGQHPVSHDEAAPGVAESWLAAGATPVAYTWEVAEGQRAAVGAQAAVGYARLSKNRLLSQRTVRDAAARAAIAPVQSLFPTGSRCEEQRPRSAQSCR